MGTIQHHAIVVTAGHEQIEEALRHVGDCKVIGPSDGERQGYRTICIVPDGSKEGWPHSNAGDDAREKLRTWLETSGLDRVEVTFGEYAARVTAGACLEDL